MNLTELLNTDFCPWANRYVYWLKEPLGVLLVAAVAALVCGICVASQGFVVFAAILATLLLGVAWPGISLRGLSCELEFSQRRGREGEAVPVIMVLRNRWPFPIWGLAIEDGFFTSTGDGDHTAVALSGIRGWSRTQFRWNFVPHCRGIYPTRPVKLVTEFPFGLWKGHREVRCRQQLVVWPRTFPLTAANRSVGRGGSLVMSTDAQTGNEGDRVGVRLFRCGDSMRMVHWPQTAKFGQLIACERQGPVQSAVLIAIDTNPVWHERNHCDAPFEWQIRIAASIAEQLIRQDIRVVMRANNQSWEITTRRDTQCAAWDWLTTLMPVELQDLKGVRNFDDCFYITSSTYGPPATAGMSHWKNVVLQPVDKPSVADQAWIQIQLGLEPVETQFARLWRQKMIGHARNPFKRSVGVAS